MDVDHAVREGRQQAGFYDAHETRERHRVHAMIPQDLDRVFLSCSVQLGLEGRTIDVEGRDIPLARAFEDERVRMVGEYASDAGCQPTFRDRDEERFEVTAFAGAEDTEVQHDQDG